MQGQSSSMTTLPENLGFDHGSTSSDAAIDSHVSWTSLQASEENRVPEYIISSSDTNSQYLHRVGREGLNGVWTLGESSSSASQNQANHSERKREHAWSIRSRAALHLEERHCEPTNILPLDAIDVDSHDNQTDNGSSTLQISGPDAISQDLNMFSEFRDSEDDECQIVERPSTQISVRSSKEKMPHTGSSSDAFGLPSGCSGYGMEGSDYRPGCSLDGQRMSCKRKALEVHTGQSIGEGSSNFFEHAGRSQWHAVSAPQNTSSNVSISTRAEHNLHLSNESEPANSGIRLGIGAVSANPYSSSVRGTAESSRRNLRLRINSAHHQDHHITGIPFSTEANVGNSDVSSSRHSSRLVLRNRLVDLNPTPAVENGSHYSQTVLSHVPSVRRNTQTRWSVASSTRTRNSSASAVSVERERDAILYGESTSGSLPRSISEHPMFVPASEMGSSSQHPTNWNMAGGSNNIAGHIASTSRAGSASGVNSSSPTWPHRSYAQYPRRLTEIVRRSLLSSVGTESGGQSSNHATRLSSPGVTQEMVMASGPGNHGHHISNLRSALLERHLDGAFGLPHSLRSLAVANEGRSSIMSEQIRHVLDLMRRGEGLRIEDMMILDQSGFFGMGDAVDRHRDMRMDVDNMSYEELLALGERIGDVCTGLTEETIAKRLKLRKYPTRPAGEAEPCSICREEYDDGVDMGILECGHDFHRDCIKQWLLHKNLCPICKMTGLTK